MRWTGWMTVAALAWSGPGLAQIERLPSQSRGEIQAGAINRSLQTQEQTRVIQQQNQFELNSLRNDLSRPVAPIGPGAPPVQIGR